MDAIRGKDLITLQIPSKRCIAACKRILNDELAHPGTSPQTIATIQHILSAIPDTLPAKGLMIHAGYDNAGTFHFYMNELLNAESDLWFTATKENRFRLTDRI